jgi:hypothetical protein
MGLDGCITTRVTILPFDRSGIELGRI